MARRSPTFTLALATVACSPDADREPLAHQLDDAQAHADELRIEVTEHADAALAVADLAELQGMEATHDEVVRRHMDELDHAIEDMGMCDGVPDDRIDAMMGARDECGGERSHHHESVTAAADLDAARTEEQRHRTAMIGCLEDMSAMMHDMSADYGMMMCSGHHGMDDHDRP